MPSPHRFEMRKANLDDAPRLSQLAFHSKAYWGYSPSFMEACRAELTYSPNQLNHPKFCFYLAEQANTLVGFYGLEQLSLAETELIALFVASAFMGQGLGRALLNHAQGQAKLQGAKTLIIQSDPNAQAFYGVMGARRAVGTTRI